MPSHRGSEFVSFLTRGRVKGRMDAKGGSECDGREKRLSEARCVVQVLPELRGMLKADGGEGERGCDEQMRDRPGLSGRWRAIAETGTSMSRGWDGPLMGGMGPAQGRQGGRGTGLGLRTALSETGAKCERGRYGPSPALVTSIKVFPRFNELNNPCYIPQNSCPFFCHKSPSPVLLPPHMSSRIFRMHGSPNHLAGAREPQVSHSGEGKIKKTKTL